MRQGAQLLRISSVLSGAVIALLLGGTAQAQTSQPTPTSAAGGPVAISGELPTELQERQAFETPLRVTGGTPPIRWSIVAGSLPEGVVLHSKTGLVHGSPAKRGEYRFSVQARDANNVTVTRAFELSVLYKPASRGLR